MKILVIISRLKISIFESSIMSALIFIYEFISISSKIKTPSII